MKKLWNLFAAVLMPASHPCLVCAAHAENIAMLKDRLEVSRAERERAEQRRDEYRALAGKAAAELSQAEQRHADTQGLLSEQIKAADRYRVAHAKLALATRQPFEARETDGAPPFDEDDRTRWREFLATPTGKRLMQSLNWWSQYEEQAATLRKDRHEYACGSASGFRRCAQFAIHKLSADTRLQQGEDTRAQNGASDLRERIAP